MIAGHPWCTEQLDALRAEQRRVLRDLDDAFVGDHTDPPKGIPRGPDRQALELDIRQQAKAVISQAGNLLAVRLATSRGHRLHTFLNQNWRSLRAPMELTTLLDLADDSPADPPSMEREDLKLVHTITWLLVVADYLADDDYMDPRIPSSGTA